MNAKRTISIIYFGILALLLQACGGATIAPTATKMAPTDTSVPPTATPTPIEGIKIYFEGNAQVELISKNGTRVMIDVYDSSQLSSPANAKDILLTTHGHADHYYSNFVRDFPGKTITMEIGQIEQSGIRITSIASSHTNDAPQEENGTNYIFLIEMDGMRIAHFGDIGQTDLIPSQKAELGKVDVAFSQLSNPFSDMSLDNQKGFHLIEQVDPRIFVVTHGVDKMDVIEQVTKHSSWKVFAAEMQPVTLNPSMLEAGLIKVLIMGPSASSMKSIFLLADW